MLLSGRPESAAPLRLLCACLALALCHCHDRDVLHRDLRPPKVLVDHTGLYKLGGFGLAASLPYGSGLTRKTLCGRPEYLAPELLSMAHGYDHEVDFWALGCVAFEASHGFHLFRTDSPKTSETAVLDAADGKYRNAILKVFRDADFYQTEFIQDLLKPLSHRLNKRTVMKHPYFAGIDLGALKRGDTGLPKPRSRPVATTATDASTFHPATFSCFTGGWGPFEAFGGAPDPGLAPTRRAS